MSKKNIIIEGPISPLTKCKFRCFSLMPTLTILSVIAFFYITYMVTFLMPRLYLRTSNYDYEIIKMHLYQLDLNVYETYFIILHYLLFWFIISMVRSMTMKHHEVPRDESDLKLQEYHKEYQDEKRRSKDNSGLFDNLIRDDIVNVIETAIRDEQFKKFMKSNGYRFCEFCNIVKPKRAHHCRQCGKCIMKMDHHCNWLYNCIGYSNYKYFLVFLFYTDLLLMFIMVTYLEALVESYVNPEIQDVGFFVRSFCFFLNATFAGICFIFTGFHVFYLLGTGKTTLEYCEKRDVKDELFEQGWIYNFREIFGCNPLFWFFPINTTTKYKLESLYGTKQYTSQCFSNDPETVKIFSTDHELCDSPKTAGNKLHYIDDSKADLLVQAQYPKNNESIED